MVEVQRGQIWWAELGVPVGSAPGFRRPLLIVQSDAFNRSRISTVIAVPLSSNITLAEAPGNLLLPKRLTGLPRDSVANVSQVITVDRAQLTGRTGRLPAREVAAIDAGLRLVLAI